MANFLAALAAEQANLRQLTEENSTLQAQNSGLEGVIPFHNL
jgi:cell division protein FtsB